MTTKALISILVCVSALGCSEKPQETHLSNLGFAEKEYRESPSFENVINLGMAYSSQGQHEESLKWYLKARDMSPKSPLAWNNVCAEMNSVGRHFEALESCRRAVELEPKFGLAKKNFDLTEQKVAELKKIAQDRFKAYQKAPSSLTANQVFELGNAFFQMQNFDEAISLWSKLKTADSEYAKAQFNISTAWILLKNNTKALSHLETALKVEPTNPMFQNNLQWLKSQGSKRPASE